jgi:hypothetical protein
MFRGNAFALRGDGVGADFVGAFNDGSGCNNSKPGSLEATISSFFVKGASGSPPRPGKTDARCSPKRFLNDRGAKFHPISVSKTTVRRQNCLFLASKSIG